MRAWPQGNLVCVGQQACSPTAYMTSEKLRFSDVSLRPLRARCEPCVSSQAEGEHPLGDRVSWAG